MAKDFPRNRMGCNPGRDERQVMEWNEMNRDDLVERERIKLEAERTEIEAKIQHLGEWLKGEVDIDAEEGDPDLFEREKNLALLNTLERRLEQTISAIARH